VQSSPLEGAVHDHGIQKASVIGRNQHRAAHARAPEGIEDLGAHPKERGNGARDLYEIVAKIIYDPASLLLFFFQVLFRVQ